jgi:undecaprenyl-diphosphatase
VVSHSGLLDAARGVSHLGDPLVVTGLSALLAAACWLAGRRHAALAVVVARAVAIVTSSGVKAIVDRPRPHVLDPVAHASSSAFPSGHALGSAALWGVLAFALSDRLGRLATVTVATAVPLVVATSRVLLGVHWPSDVVAGLCAGWAIALAVAGWCRVPTAPRAPR